MKPSLAALTLASHFEALLTLREVARSFMDTVEQIEEAILKLAPDDFFRLYERMSIRFGNEWDAQIEEDVRAGRLDHLARQAIAEHRAGKSLPFPPDQVNHPAGMKQP